MKHERKIWPHETSDEQSDEKSDEKSNEQSYEQSDGKSDEQIGPMNKNNMLLKAPLGAWRPEWAIPVQSFI